MASADELDMLELLLAQDGAAPGPAADGPRRESAAAPSMSRAQRRLWFLQQAAPDNPAYNIVCAVRLRGRLHPGALRLALDALVRRHEALRTVFPMQAGRATAQLMGGSSLDACWHEPGEPVREEQVSPIIAAEARRPFDLGTGPLLRFRLLRLGAAEHVAVLVLHHVAGDGWSMGVLVAELGRLYGAFVEGQTLPLPDPVLQYGDFAAWQERWLAGEDAAAQRRWWTERLAGLEPLDLPTDRPRPAEPSYRGGEHPVAVPDRAAAALRTIGRREGATPYMTLLAAFAVFLHRYTGQDSVVVGSPVANRGKRELEAVVGLLVNTLVMRCDLSGRPGFREVLRRVRDFTLGAIANQDLPFEEVVKAAAPERDGVANPLFQVMFAVEPAMTGPAQLPGVTLEPVHVPAQSAKFDLLLNMGETADGGLAGAFEYAADLFDAATVARMADNFAALLQAIADAPDTDIGLLPLLSAGERRRLAEWNDTGAPYPRDAGLAQLFRAQALRSPGAVAVQFGPERLTYAELDAAAGRLARRLRHCGVGPGTSVAIHARRSASMVVGLLAVLRTGGFYVPLDPALPGPRLHAILDDSRAKVLLTQRALLAQLPATSPPILCIDDEPPGDGVDDRLEGSGGDLAYVMYTSGSTGTPKGVAVPQRAVSRLVINANYVALGPEDSVAQASNGSFDAATFEIWGALLNGARLVGVDQEVVLSPPALAAFLREEGITALFLTTALFNQIVREKPDAFATLQHLLFGGEQADPQRVRQVLRHGPPARLLHVYGPTENTTFSTWKLVREVPEGAVTVAIGKPVSNTRLHVLDARGQPVPVGVPGELHLAGDGLALGYHGRPDLTAERFVPGEFGGLLYRTGDVVRQLPDGDVQFIGRRDDQVKIRGFRIELGEVEAALSRHPTVGAAAVLARESRPGQRELVAYVVPVSGAGFAPHALRRDLAALLPAYMVPSRWQELPSLPLNENGKVDRKALPAPSDAPDARSLPQPPLGERERCLAQVWQDVLGRGPVGTGDNYFELGGDSITAIQIVSRLLTLGWQMRVGDLFRHPTIATLAPCLQAAGQNGAEQEDDGSSFPLTAIQRWFFDHHLTDRSHFNQAVLLAAAEPLDELRLRAALDELLRRHDALRLRFADEGAVVQRCAPRGETAVLDLIDLSGEADPADAMLRHADEIQRGLDLRHGPLLRAVLFRRLDGDRLLLVIHHLAVDAVSWRILLDELETAYRGETARLQPVPCSFRRWAERMRDFAGSEQLADEETYWSKAEAAGSARLPLADAAAPARRGDAQTVHATLDTEDTADLLTRAHAAFKTEIMDLLLTALGRVLKRWTGRDGTRITLEGHGRESPDDELSLSGTVGWFTSLYPFLLDTRGSDIGEQVLRMKAAVRRVPRKGVGYLQLRHGPAGAGRRPKPGETPHFGFNYLGQFADGGTAGLFRVSGEPTGSAAAPGLPRPHALDLTGLVGGGRLLLSLEFDPAQLDRNTADALVRDCADQVGEVVRYCSALAAPARNAAAGGIEDAYPLSPLQEGMLFQSLLQPGTEAYLVQVRFQATGRLDEEAFSQAWAALCGRHAVLRSAFVHQDLPRPMQVVLRDRLPEITFGDLRHLAPGEQAAWLDACCADARRRGFDLQRDPLLRVAVFREAGDVHHIVWTYHHILIDGWCLAILQRDFQELYAALLDRRPPRLPPAIPYRAYIDWLGAQDRAAAQRHWRDRLHGYEEAATLPRTAGAGARPTRTLAEELLELDSDASARLTRLAARAGVTLNTVMLALWALILARYGDRDDVVFGTVVSGRPAELAGVEGVVGLFISAVPVRVLLRPDMTFLDLVRSLQDAALESGPHQHLPLADIQAESALGRDLFSHVLVFENYPLTEAAAASGDGLLITPLAAHDPTHYDLDITVVPGERLAVKFAFDVHVHTPDQILRCTEHLRTAVGGVLQDPAPLVRDLDILPPAERALIVAEFNATEAECPPGHSFLDLFEAWAARMPGAAALRCGETELSYDALNRAASRLAHHLRASGVREEMPVGVCVGRGPAMVVVALAVLKAGGTFVPLDPGYPPERLAVMLDDARIAVIVSDSVSVGRLPEHGAGLVLLDQAADAIAACPGAAPPRRNDPARTAYAVFTSGSTGRPKGVAVCHGALANLAFALRRAYDLDSFQVRLLQMASMSFDVFMGDLVRALANGGLLVICPQEALADPRALHALVASQRISILEATPGVVLPLMEHVFENGLPLDHLRVLVIGSDTLPAEHYRTLVQRFGGQFRLINSYGVSEATVDSSCFEAADPAALDGAVDTPIGKPLSNVRLYVLDRHGRPQPLGVPGELHIGGAGLARGYLHRPDLTAARFVTSPYLPGERLYRTGDLARWMPGGNAQFLGRIDDQIKIRGYRIEPGEIEAQLLRCEGVEAAVVVGKDLGSGKELAAYIAAATPFDVGRVREALRRALPGYMVPAFLVRLDRLPLGRTGKVDKRALPDPRAAAERTAAPVPPATRTEAVLAGIWRRVLQVPRIGIRDDFFELGGHSLKALQVTAQIHKAFGVEVPLRAVFESPTIAELAGVIEAGERSAWSPIPPAPPAPDYALSHAQKRLWLLHQMDDAAAYNMPEAHLIDAEIDADRLNRAFGALVQRHEALRTAFVSTNGEPRQQIWTAIPFRLAEYDLRGTADAERRARAIVEQCAHTAFDLAAPPLLRAALVHMPGARCLFVLTIHHIVGDGWSGNLVFRELLALYAALAEGRADPLPPLRVQYKDFAAWQNARGFAREEAYWVAQMAGAPERLALPYDFALESERRFTGGNETVALGGVTAAGLRTLAVRRRTTLSNVVLALFQVFLFQWTRQDDICIGMSVANRSHPDVEELIGFFVNMLPIRCRVSAALEFEDLLTQVIERTQDALEHQDYPFDMMVERLNPARQANRQPLLNVVYTYQNFADVQVAAADPGVGSGTGAEWAAFDFAVRTSKFDLTLFVIDEPDRIELTFEYDSELFAAETIREQLGVMAGFADMVIG